MGFFDLFKRRDPKISPRLPMGLVYGDVYYSSPVLSALYTQISFYVFNESPIEEFIPMAFELINQILPPYYVVTHIDKSSNSVSINGKPKPPSPETLMTDYHRFLSAFCVLNAMSEQKDELVVQTDCGNIPITKLLLDEDSMSFTFNMYAYHEPIEMSTFEQVKARFKDFDYVIHFYYDPCPQYLSIIFDTRIISIEDLKRIIAEVCVRYDKELDIDL